MSEYHAIWFNENKQIKIRVKLNSTGLSFDFNQSHHHIHLRQLDLNLGGFENNQLILDAQGYQLMVDDFTFLDEIYAYSSIKIQEKIDQIKKQKGKALRRFYWILLALVLIFFIACAGFILSLKVIKDSLVESIPIEWESQLGSSIFEHTVKKNAIHNPIVEQALNQIQQRFAKHLDPSPYSFSFSVIQDDEVNAFALPGGHMIIHSALILQTDSPEELAGVMAHEIQHILNRHSIKQLVSNLELLTVFTLFFGDSSGLLTLLEETGLRLVTTVFDREQEREADQKGLQLLIQSHINPQGMISFFDKLSKKESDSPTILKFLSTHPTSQERVLNLKSSLKSEQFHPFEMDWDSVKDALKK